MVEKGYIVPTVITIDGITGPKPEDTWDKNDLNYSKWNNQGLNAITKEKCKKISNCTTSKQVCLYYV